MSTVTIDRDVYESEKKAVPADEGIELVGCGKTFGEHEIAIMSEDGRLLGEGEVGEIVFRGPSVTNGYYQNEEASKALLDGGWLHSGDLGFAQNGQLFISGRKKDLVILNGRNYYPQAIEWEVEQIEGIRIGNVVAFSVSGENSEELVVVAETKVTEDPELLARAVQRRVHDAFGVRPRAIELVGPGALPKTSSGKLQRRKTKQLFESGSLGVENRTMGSTATKVALARHITRSALARFTHNLKKKTTRPAMKLVAAVRRQESR
jgi:fatty-acyl-CoA synthase